MHGASGQLAFGYQHDATALRFFETVVDELFQLVHFGAEFRDDGSFGTSSDGTVQSQEASITAHDFHEEQTFV